MIIITGLGRCGTSILTKYLGEVGFGLGKNISWNSEMRAGLELSTAYLINRELWVNYCKSNKKINLNDKCRHGYWNCSYKEAIEKVDKDERQGKVDIFKDPRLTWNPELIESWWCVRKDIKLIICHRDIEQIYKSRKSMEPHQDDPKRTEINEYKIDFADFFTEVLKLDIPYILLFYPKFLENFDSTWEELCKIGLTHDYNNGKNIWNKIIDKNLLIERK
jgi:hypothetical protein